MITSTPGGPDPFLGGRWFGDAAVLQALKGEQ
jgi:hypothetical protein